jgi:hypothetical protein
VGLVGFALEMESLNEMSFGLFRQVLLWHSLGDHSRIVCDGDNLVVARELLVDLVGMNFINLNRARLCLILKLCFLDEGIDKVVDGTILGNEQIICILNTVVSTQYCDDTFYFAYHFGNAVTQ